eukprot:1374872-Amorphochlora_amoeboformis.AAC.2
MSPALSNNDPTPYQNPSQCRSVHPGEKGAAYQEKASVGCCVCFGSIKILNNVGFIFGFRVAFGLRGSWSPWTAMPHLSFRSCKNPVSGTRMTRRMMSPTAFLAVTVFVVVLIMCHPASKRLGASRNLRLTERQSSETKNVNFTGKWVLHKIEGDIDQFFKDQDWSWAFRKVGEYRPEFPGIQVSFPTQPA